MSFQYECRVCGNSEVLSSDNVDWKCSLCAERPRGLTYLHVCTTCNSRRWGIRNDIECTNCIANNLTKRANGLHVKVEHFGEMKNMPRRNKQAMFDKIESINDSIIEAQKQAQINEKREIPDLLRQILAKLDRIQPEPEEATPEQIQRLKKLENQIDEITSKVELQC